MAKRKAKRYSEEEKEEILKFIEDFGRGGMTAAVKKYKVTAATIYSWKNKAGSPSGSVGRPSSSNKSKELQNIEALVQILAEIEQEEAKLAMLQKQFEKVKGKI